MILDGGFLLAFLFPLSFSLLLSLHTLISLSSVSPLPSQLSLLSSLRVNLSPFSLFFPLSTLFFSPLSSVAFYSFSLLLFSYAFLTQKVIFLVADCGCETRCGCDCAMAIADHPSAAKEIWSAIAISIGSEISIGKESDDEVAIDDAEANDVRRDPHHRASRLDDHDSLREGNL